MSFFYGAWFHGLKLGFEYIPGDAVWFMIIELLCFRFVYGRMDASDIQDSD